MMGSSEWRRTLGVDVLAAARNRIAFTFDACSRVYVSFSGGKDSTVMLHLVMEEAIRRGRRVGVLCIDLEAQYALTIEHVAEIYRRYSGHIDPYWVALPLKMRNAVSQFETHWMCWDPDRRSDWVRPQPTGAIIDETAFPFFLRGMEFEEFVPAFGEWYSQGEPTACFVGIRTTESLNRWRTIVASNKTRLFGKPWTTQVSEQLYNVYPIYDWQTRDIWVYHGKTGLPHNRLYDRMHQAGLSIHQMRICQPYGDDQRKGLWLFQIIEPQTWARIVARVNGANQGALYAQETGNILGNIKISKPEGHTWRSFAQLLLSSMPGRLREHYENKILVFLKWHADRGYPDGIPDEGALARDKPSWTRICKALLRNDYWCKGIGFSQQQSGNWEKYRDLMRRRREQWGIML